MPDLLFTEAQAALMSACPPRHVAASLEAKCMDSVQACVYGMLNAYIWQSARKAACMLWEDSERNIDTNQEV
jgi:hypothetical protein